MKTTILSVTAGVLVLFGTTQAFEIPDVVPAVTFNMPINITDKNNATVPITGTIQQAPKGEEKTVTINIEDGIAYLSNLPGLTQNDTGQCGRVSCSYNSAILWRNTDVKKKYVPWLDIADSAFDMCL
ncbi:hypothetical protein QC762_603310 [Podospora pseudocomata]|uniref:Uncharacterized protein n=1 Tax=Podospora pseudocomata TaxID=2093779 RepID=A0ABR0G700_9PEZI|nr:hypothetical protein QC762_603310 [Podospora pseudocomata]